MKKVLNILIAASLVLASCTNKNADAKAEKDSYEKTKETLEEKEKKNPTAFLKASAHDKRNLIGQTVIKGTVTNNAKVCTYKDVELELSFFSKTGTLLEKDNETVYDEIAPGNSANFKTKYFAPKGTDSVGVKIVSAKTN
ncbi:FxLYD domain-containing protein [Ferruginibacter lapsinanis]|uniref:FxLYD domain-containing protein n=1 Tax=Ferruginibacter lapsinanis TaxID=563172 RepID=UPI001E5F3535|nr:FxLYD domain-containing protein [Ferruginibacter lapsinanis]UEG51256.1 FxLYD domain-containing protein [Ferruginibacter lapsinanis]